MEEKGFIKEQVTGRKGIWKKKVCYYLRVIISALLFGFLSAAAFVLTEPLLRNYVSNARPESVIASNEYVRGDWKGDLASRESVIMNEGKGSADMNEGKGVALSEIQDARRQGRTLEVDKSPDVIEKNPKAEAENLKAGAENPTTDAEEPENDAEVLAIRAEDSMVDTDELRIDERSLKADTEDAGANEGGLKTGAEDPESGEGSLKAGEGDPKAGEGSLKIGAEDSGSGEGGLKAGAEDPESGEGGLKAGAEDPESGKEALKAGAEDPESGKGTLKAGAEEPKADGAGLKANTDNLMADKDNPTIDAEDTGAGADDLNAAPEEGGRTSDEHLESGHRGDSSDVSELMEEGSGSVFVSGSSVHGGEEDVSGNGGADSDGVENASANPAVTGVENWLYYESVQRDIKQLLSRVESSLAKVTKCTKKKDFLGTEADVETDYSGVIIAFNKKEVLIMTPLEAVEDMTTLKVSFSGPHLYTDEDHTGGDEGASRIEQDGVKSNGQITNRMPGQVVLAQAGGAIETRDGESILTQSGIYSEEEDDSEEKRNDQGISDGQYKDTGVSKGLISETEYNEEGLSVAETLQNGDDEGGTEHFDESNEADSSATRDAGRLSNATTESSGALDESSGNSAAFGASGGAFDAFSGSFGASGEKHDYVAPFGSEKIDGSAGGQEAARVPFRYRGVVKSKDKIDGFAVISVPVKDISASDLARLREIPFGDSGKLSPGDLLFAVGGPAGVPYSSAFGMVSYLSGSSPFIDNTLSLVLADIRCEYSIGTFILNTFGELVGWLPRNLQEEYAACRKMAAISDIRDYLETVSRGESVPFIGVNMQEVTAEMSAEGIPSGIFVRGTEKNSPAFLAGIQPGDVIIRMNGNVIASVPDYHGVLSETGINGEVELTVLRERGPGDYAEVLFSMTTESR